MFNPCNQSGKNNWGDGWLKTLVVLSSLMFIAHACSQTRAILSRTSELMIVVSGLCATLDTLACEAQIPARRNQLKILHLKIFISNPSALEISNNAPKFSARRSSDMFWMINNHILEAVKVPKLLLNLTVHAIIIVI